MFKVHEEAIVNIIDSNITKTKLEKGPISENIKKKTSGQYWNRKS